MIRVHELSQSGEIINTLVVEFLVDGLVDSALYPCSTIGDSIINGQLIPHQQPSGPSFAEQKAAYLDEVREMRAQVLARLNGYGATLYLKDPPAVPEEKANCALLIQGLLDITTIEPVQAAADMFALKAAVKAEYARLVGLGSTELLKAFRQVDM